MYKIDFFKNTGFDGVNIPCSPSMVYDNFSVYKNYIDINIIQGRWISEIILDEITPKDMEDVDYCIAYNEEDETEITCYFVSEWEFVADGTCKIYLLLDAYNTMGGFEEGSGNIVVSGSARRLTVPLKHVDAIYPQAEDNTFFSLDEPFQPCERLLMAYNDFNFNRGDGSVSTETYYVCFLRITMHKLGKYEWTTPHYFIDGYVDGGDTESNSINLSEYSGDDEGQYNSAKNKISKVFYDASEYYKLETVYPNCFSEYKTSLEDESGKYANGVIYAIDISFNSTDDIEDIKAGIYTSLQTIQNTVMGVAISNGRCLLKGGNTYKIISDITKYTYIYQLGFNLFTEYLSKWMSEATAGASAETPVYKKCHLWIREKNLIIEKDGAISNTKIKIQVEYEGYTEENKDFEYSL